MPDSGVSPTGSGGSPELVVIAKPEAALRARASGVTSAAAVDTSSLELLLVSHGASLRPLFGLSEDRLHAQIRELSAPRAPVTGDGTRPPEPLPDLERFYRVAVDEERLEQVADALRSHGLVEAAYVKPAGAPPEATMSRVAQLNDMQPDAGDAPPASPDFVSRQGYLATAPVGVDAMFAWTLPGGSGGRVRIIDCEWAWRFTHEDLLQNQGGVVAGSSSGDTNHGTAVLGVISGDRNAIGITGISPDATISASSFSDQSSSAAIKAAADKLGAGDIILLEIHRPGPAAPNPLQGQLGFIAIEWWPDDFAAIRYAVAKGIIVVEAAGNGTQNLDAAIYDTPQTGFPSSWRNPFNPGNPSSGAVVVGAGAPPPGTHGRDNGPDRSRLDFSNFGARVDVQGWGREVTSTGYGDLQGGSNQDLWYTDQFSGTSSASPVVVGTLAATQGALRSRGHRILTSEGARRLLRSCGSPQTDAPGRPASQRIGKRPNLRELIPSRGEVQVAQRRLRRRRPGRVPDDEPVGDGHPRAGRHDAGRADHASQRDPLRGLAPQHRGQPLRAARRLRRRWPRRDADRQSVGHRNPRGVRYHDGGPDDAAERHALRRLAAEHRRQLVRTCSRLRRRPPRGAPRREPVGGRHPEAGRHDDGGADDGAERHALRRVAAEHRRQLVRPGGRFRRGRPRRDPGHEPVGHRGLQAHGKHVQRADDGAERHALRRVAVEHRRQHVRPGGRLRRGRPRRDHGHQPVGSRGLQADRSHVQRADDGAERHALRRVAAEHRRQLVRPGRGLRRRPPQRRSSSRARGASAS